MATVVKNPQVGRNVRRLRLEKKLSIRAFCALVVPPITPVQLLATEKLKREPEFDTVRRYARALNVTIDALLAPDVADSKKAKKS
jgi:transcriptional regulator with XRE-family HTH domain